jgi:shikimate kinase
MSDNIRIALTGFMGVGKSSVARHLSHILHCDLVDLDALIEQDQARSIADIIDKDGIDAYRAIETDALRSVVDMNGGRILSLGGGTWTLEGNRSLILEQKYQSIWLESSFEHCWYNIKFSRKDRPLARNKKDARILFDERQSYYSLADWHFLVRPEFNSYEIAAQIVEQIF